MATERVPNQIPPSANIIALPFAASEAVLNPPKGRGRLPKGVISNRVLEAARWQKAQTRSTPTAAEDCAMATELDEQSIAPLDVYRAERVRMDREHARLAEATVDLYFALRTAHLMLSDCRRHLGLPPLPLS